MCLIWRVCANTLLLSRSWLFSSSFILQEINAQRHVNLQFWSQKWSEGDCCVKTICVLIEVVLSISDITIGSMGRDSSVAVLAVNSVQFSLWNTAMPREAFSNSLSSVLHNSFCLSLLPNLYVHMGKFSKIISQFNHSSYVRMLEVWHLEVWLVKITCGWSELLVRNCKLAFSKMIFDKNCWWKIKKQTLSNAEIKPHAWVLIGT